MILPPPISTRTVTLFPYTSRFLSFHIQQLFLYLLPFPISASCCIPGALAVVRCQFEYLLFFFLDLLANLLYCRRRALKMSLLRQRLAASSHNLSCAVSTLTRLLPRCPPSSVRRWVRDQIGRAHV